MNYQESLAHLQDIFLKHNFKDHQANSRKHAAMVEVDRCQNGSVMSSSFPGYKATPDKPDYRVDITKNEITTSLSHANIIVDIVNKCVAGGMNPSALRQALTNQAVNCTVDYKVSSKHYYIMRLSHQKSCWLTRKLLMAAKHLIPKETVGT